MAAPKPFTPISVAEAVHRYRDLLHLRVATGALSPATRDAYARDLTEAAALLGLDKPLDDVEAEDIEYALVRIANAPDRRFTRTSKAGPGGEPAPGRGLQARARWTAAVRGLFAWAAEQGYVRADPMPEVSRVRVPTRAAGARLGLTVEQAQALRQTPAAAASAKPAAEPAPPPSKPIGESATSNVGGIAWRWPSGGKVIGTYVAGDQTKQGVDIAGSAGDPVLAAADGEVVYIGNGLLGYCELGIVKHNASFLSAYGHNRKRLVAEGDKVRAGQQIAEMGSSASSRDELHFEIRKNGKPVNPLDYLPAR